VATGAGGVAFEIAQATPPTNRITGADFCKEIVDLGKEKVAASPASMPEKN